MSFHAQSLLSRQPLGPSRAVRLAAGNADAPAGPALAAARLHEACGRARHGFAAWLAARTDGPVFWISLDRARSRLNPDGLAEFAQPGRFTFLAPDRPVDLLWCMEECLRSGLVPLVVADLPDPPGLTPVRRLHLAAETGARDGPHAPLGLILTPGTGDAGSGAPGVESRWRMEPAHGPAARTRGWSLTRLRARTAPVQAWRVDWEKSGRDPRQPAGFSPRPPDPTPLLPPEPEPEAR